MFTKKDLFKLIIPLIVEQLLAVTIGMADTVMVASVGEAAVSGISLVDTINLLLINVFSALATGGAIVSAQYLGRDDTKNASIAAKQLIMVTAILSLILMVIGLAGNVLILNIIFGNTEYAVMENAKTYFFLSALSYPFIAVYNACAALFRSMRNSKISMLTSLLMNIVNIGGNAILIFHFDMGVAGAGTASLLSRMLGAIIMLALLKNKNNKIYISKLFKLDFKPVMIKNILSIGIPNGLENGMFQIGKILVQGLIASFGTVAIAANAVANGIASMSQIPGQAIGLSLITIVGQCVGAKNFDDAKKYMIKLTKITYASMGVLNIIILLAVSPLVGFYQLSPETTKLTIELLVYHSICCLILWPAAFTLPCGLRAANDVKYTMTISIISMWIFRIGLSYVIARGFGLGVLGVWVAMTIDWAFRSVCFVTRFVRGKWKNNSLI